VQDTMLILRNQGNIMSKKLAVIARIAKQDKSVRFTSLMHLLNKENLAICFKMLEKNAAPGIDEVTIKAYGENLDANLESLVSRLKDKWYKPKPVRRVYIPKPGKQELRPLGIPSVEDKVVQMALKWILQAIYEQDFLDCSYGFRPNRSCHSAIKELDAAVMKRPVNYIVEVDIRKFFNTVGHGKLLELLQLRIADPNILWLIHKFLKAGIMDAGTWQASEDGVPQGGIVSPILANIYLHYVLDVWFESKFQKQAKGYTKLIRYADDFVALCESKYDADRFILELEERLAEFNLVISKEKTRSIKFGRQVWKQAQREGVKVETFDFLGFTHYCGKSRKGWFAMGHKTSKLSLNAKLKSNNNWLRNVRNMLSVNELWPIIKAKLIGHYNYFGISGNIRSLAQYFFSMKLMVFKWINRRSQKKSMDWKQFQKYLDWNPLPTPRIYHAILY
jgi:RNA-directed DNA polymerase